MTQTNKPPESREIYRLEANTPLWLVIKDNPEALRQLREDMLQTLLTEREELREKVESIVGEEIRDEGHECHLGCCGNCWCNEIDMMIKKSDVLKLLE